MDVSSLCTVDMINLLIGKSFRKDKTNKLELLIEDLEEDNDRDEETKEIISTLESYNELQELTYYLNLSRSHSKLLPSIVKAPKFDLKTLPNHLKYVYLRDYNNLPVTISNKLSSLDRLINVQKEIKGTIGWTIADIN
ncbi:hypothetical protein Scep_015037 [Stephania cephalantha]|uniref:Uncharacterized protein n=1 Tax=Stephania cephalantha TaxID=152367 RepID=A0AAP0P3K7_9MAGN